IFVAHESPLDDVVYQVVVMRIRGKRQIGQHRSQMEHGSELNTQFAAAVDADAELKRLTDAGGLNTRTNTTPKGRIEQDDVDSRIEDVGRKLLKIDHDGIGGKGDFGKLPHPSHAGESKRRILQVV